MRTRLPATRFEWTTEITSVGRAAIGEQDTIESLESPNEAVRLSQFIAALPFESDE